MNQDFFSEQDLMRGREILNDFMKEYIHILKDRKIELERKMEEL